LHARDFLPWHTFTLESFMRFLVTVLLCAIAASAIAQPVTTGTAADASTSAMLSTLLKKLPKPDAKPDNPYAEIPAAIEPAVRALGEERYSSATELLERELKKSSAGPERTKVLMWLGLVHGTHALDYPKQRQDAGTSAAEYLRQAIQIDPLVRQAPDVVRVLAEMMAYGWSGSESDPNSDREAAEKEAEASRNALDFYAAGMMFRRESQRQWAFGDTTELDRRAFSLLAKAVAIEPERYELWAGYLPAMMPVGMHDAMNVESYAMYDHFKALRAPTIGDQGPAALHVRTRTGQTMQDDDDFMADIIKARPDDPYPYFQLALWAIETTPALAVSRFDEFLEKIDKGTIKLLPREQGYKVSALYKLAFLKHSELGAKEGLVRYEKVRAISSTYAEVNGNLAVIHAVLSDEATEKAEKIQLMEKALEYAKVQEALDYRGLTLKKASELRRKMEVALTQMNDSSTSAPVAAPVAP
jgi:hypothetical protein